MSEETQKDIWTYEKERQEWDEYMRREARRNQRPKKDYIIPLLVASVVFALVCSFIMGL